MARARSIGKRPFMLVEVVVALTLFATILVPLASQPWLYLRRHLALLEELEKERYANLIFYDLLSQFRTKHPQWTFGTAVSPCFHLPDCEIDFKRFGKRSIDVHYHLRFFVGSTHYAKTIEQPIRKLWLILVLHRPGEPCPYPPPVGTQEPSKNLYKFSLIVEKEL